jgi:GTPase
VAIRPGRLVPGIVSVYIQFMTQQGEARVGHVAIIGAPNAGKSSLLNRFLGSKLSIVTSAAQTTRERVVGIDSRDGAQIVFLDTPGLVEPAYLLHQSMLRIVEQTLADADVVVLLLDATRDPPSIDPPIRALVHRAGNRLLIAINKSDLCGPDQVDSLSRWSLEEFGTAGVPISATTGDGVEELRARIASMLPMSPLLYPDDDISTQSVRFFVSELVRETVFERYGEEIPYSVAVMVEEFRESDDPLYIRATIFVERSSQKGILIGSGGAAIRELGSASRRKIEEFLGARVYLDLWVKVLPRWRKDPKELRRFGFPVPQDVADRHA